MQKFARGRSGLRKELCVWSHLESRICWDIKQCANSEDKNNMLHECLSVLSDLLDVCLRVTVIS
ncbi:hypothetical protein T12_2592 [Trichinella patagoniensis]|uniref:Uncharacterized protein n=1 Tax=Trichinella patagoniensis TaxID=990121 RepID=A0A0V0ZT37_9BILA|nr:hypothetical protein T12_2592 [Trichinella patagoniensis]